MDDSGRSGARRGVNWWRGTPFRIGLRVFAFGVLASVVILAVSLVLLEPLTVGQRHAKRVAREDLSLQQQCAQLRVTLVGWQLFLESGLDAIQVPGATLSPKEIAKGSVLSQTQLDQAKALSAALRRFGVADKARALDAAMSSYHASIKTLTPVAAGAHVTSAEVARIVSGERAAFATVWDLTSSIAQEVAQNITAPDVRYVTDKFGVARTMVVVVGSLALLLALSAAVVFARRVARRERMQRLGAQRHLYGTELQQALELSTTENAVYGIVGRALGDAVPELDVEMLIADSSRAHFRRVLGSHNEPERADGCGVVSPRDCPAAVRANTMQFASSDAISACPYLQDRPSGSCSAVCIPVSIAGRTVGVMHATGPNGTLPATADLENLELSARRAAERVALLRTFEKSETQARTDPLTGLLNRRSLENQVRDLHNDGVPYALAYGDLDLFKVLNDTHGHEAGDQALRLFSRVLRDAVRPADLVSRYGGEEFVIVLPDCGTDAAVIVLERVREHLALALTCGRVPAFTVSFGLTDSMSAATFDEIVVNADQALLNAKAAGRNRVVLADDPTQTPDTAEPRPPERVATAAAETT